MEQEGRWSLEGQGGVLGLFEASTSIGTCTQVATPTRDRRDRVAGVWTGEDGSDIYQVIQYHLLPTHTQQEILPIQQW